MEEGKRSRRLIRFLAVLVVLLASCNLFMIVQSGIAGRTVRGAWTAVTRAEGVRLLLGQLNLVATPEEAAQEWAQRGAELAGEGQFGEAAKAFDDLVARNGLKIVVKPTE